jgi:hypothetical protein
MYECCLHHRLKGPEQHGPCRVLDGLPRRAMEGRGPGRDRHGHLRRDLRAPGRGARPLRRWLDGWRGAGVIVEGMERSGWDVSLTRYARAGGQPSCAAPTRCAPGSARSSAFTRSAVRRQPRYDLLPRAAPQPESTWCGRLSLSPGRRLSTASGKISANHFTTSLTVTIPIGRWSASTSGMDRCPATCIRFTA